MSIEGVVFTVTSVAASGFEYIYSARKIELPNTITAFGDRAFYYCKLATEITIPESVVSLGDKTFYGCPLTEVIIPNGVTKIGNSLFEMCTELTHVEIPNTVESIGIMAFKSERESSARIGINIAAAIFDNIEKVDKLKIFGYENYKAVFLCCAE